MPFYHCIYREFIFHVLAARLAEFDAHFGFINQYRNYFLQRSNIFGWHERTRLTMHNRFLCSRRVECQHRYSGGGGLEHRNAQTLLKSRMHQQVDARQVIIEVFPEAGELQCSTKVHRLCQGAKFRFLRPAAEEQHPDVWIAVPQIRNDIEKKPVPNVE